MGGQNSWRQPLTGPDWMRDVEKRILHEERRPQISSASDLLGPGISAFSHQIVDWSSSETAFNGYFYSTPGSVNSPDPLRYWMGTSQVTQDGYGVQRVVEYWGVPLTAVTNKVWMRRFQLMLDGTRSYTPWALEDGPDTGWLDLTNWASGWASATGTLLWQVRQVGNRVWFRGGIRNAAFTGTNTVIALLPTAVTPPPFTWGFAVTGSSIARWGSVLSDGRVQISSGTADSGWYQIVGYYLTD